MWSAHDGEARGNDGGGVERHHADGDARAAPSGANAGILKLGEEARINATGTPLAIPELWDWASLNGHVERVWIGGDAIDGEAALAPGARVLDHRDTLLTPGLAEALAATVRTVCKVGGKVEFAQPGSLPNDGKVIEDARSYK